MLKRNDVRFLLVLTFLHNDGVSMPRKMTPPCKIQLNNSEKGIDRILLPNVAKDTMYAVPYDLSFGVYNTV